MLDARVQELNNTLFSSKEPQPLPAAPGPGTIAGPGNGLTYQDVFTMIVYSVASAFTQNQRGKVAPTSKVPEILDTVATEHPQYPGAIRRKIRYGPYRIPSNTVRFYDVQYTPI
jgi:hypothetical protein